MKKQLGSLFCLLVFNYVAIGQANIYHPFPQCYAEWTVSSTSVLGNSYYNYYLSGDTIVNGYRHSKVYVAYDSVTSYFDAAIMEDNNKHIYACCGHGYGSRDSLLYDFNLTVGNKVPMGTIAGGCDVVSVDSIYIGTGYRKEFNIFYGSGGASLIEGIGCSMGLFEFSPALGYSPTLDCFSQNGKISLYTGYGASCHIFKWDTTSCIPYFPPEPDTSGTYIAFTIFPNPANNTVTVHYNLTQNQQGASLNLNDAIGRLIGSISLQNTGMNSCTIDASSLANGVYYCTLILNNKPIQRRKLIIQHPK